MALHMWLPMPVKGYPLPRGLPGHGAAGGQIGQCQPRVCVHDADGPAGCSGVNPRTRLCQYGVKARRRMQGEGGKALTCQWWAQPDSNR